MRKKSRIEAELTITCKGKLEAITIFDSLEPDNRFEIKGLKVKGRRSGRKVIITVRCERGIPSLINTVEDILHCLGVTEESFSTLQSLGKEKESKIEALR
ncbi:MAG: KEOPS complex subunit Pcc1 [Thermoproteota archaeon]